MGQSNRVQGLFYQSLVSVWAFKIGPAIAAIRTICMRTEAGSSTFKGFQAEE